MGRKKSPLNGVGMLEMLSDPNPVQPGRARLLLSSVIAFLSLACIHLTAQLHQKEIWYGIKKRLIGLWLQVKRSVLD